MRALLSVQSIAAGYFRRKQGGVQPPWVVRWWHQAGIRCGAASRPVLWVLLTQKPSRQALTSNHVQLPLRSRVIRQIAMSAVAAISRCDWVAHRNRVCRPRVFYPDRGSLLLPTNGRRNHALETQEPRSSRYRAGLAATVLHAVPAEALRSRICGGDFAKLRRSRRVALPRGLSSGTAQRPTRRRNLNEGTRRCPRQDAPEQVRSEEVLPRSLHRRTRRGRRRRAAGAEEGAIIAARSPSWSMWPISAISVG